jgi:type IV secretory pathway VirB6-like protein
LVVRRRAPGNVYLPVAVGAVFPGVLDRLCFHPLGYPALMPSVLFQNVLSGVIAPLVAALQALIGPMCAAMQPVGLAAISIAACFWFFDVAAGHKTIPQVGRQAFTSALFYSMLWVGQYTQWVSDLFLNAIPQTVGAALGNQGSPWGVLDNLLTQTVSSASTVYEALPSYSLKAAMFSLGVLLFVCVVMVCLLFVALKLAIATVISILALVVGPVFLAAAVPTFTRKYAAGWLSVLVSGVVTQLLSLALIQLMVVSVGAQLGRLTTTAATTNSNSILMLWGLCQAAGLLWLFKEVVKKVPEIAQVIGGGVYHGSQAAMSATFGTAGAALSTAGYTAAGAVAGGVGGAIAGARATGTASGAALGGMSGAASGAAQGVGRGFRYAAPAAASLSRGRR